MPSVASGLLRFYTTLTPPRVPPGIQVMHPYADPAVRTIMRAFLNRFFDDERPRTLVFGINPGRFGAGITGVTFTDPVALDVACAIPNDLPRRRELSSVFIYDVIKQLGGAAAFYRRFFLTAVSPLGFTRDGKNLNYYDVPVLARAVTPFIVRCVERQLTLGARRDHAIVLGKGENFRYFNRLNEQHGWFGTLHPLDHPRPIMQYRRKRLAEYVAQYAATFRAAGRARPGAPSAAVVSPSWPRRRGDRIAP